MSIVDNECSCLAGECRIKTLPLLYEMSSLIAESADLTHTLNVVLGTMEQYMNIVCGVSQPL